MEVKIISKMSVKALACNPKKVSGMDNNPDGSMPTVSLCKIYGTATGLKHGENKNDGSVFTALLGEFEGVNTASGETFRSGILFLPGGIQDVLEAPIRAAGDESVAVRFGFEIFAIKASNPIGYSYQARPLLKPAATDALSEIRALIEALEAPAVPQLPAPAAPSEAPKPAAKPAHAGRR